MTDPVKLRVVEPTAPDVDPDVVEALNTITARAVAGDIAVVAIITVDHSGDVETCWSSANELLLAGASRLAHEINRALDED